MAHSNHMYTQETQIHCRKLYLIRDFKQEKLEGNTILASLGFSSVQDGLHVSGEICF